MQPYDEDPAPPVKAIPAPKKVYQSPVLHRHGVASELTRTGPSTYDMYPDGGAVGSYDVYAS